jgi:hypothetical protein
MEGFEATAVSQPSLPPLVPYQLARRTAPAVRT